MKTRNLSILGLLLVLSLLVTQCGATPQPQTVVQTVKVEKTVIETVEVEKEIIQTVEVEKEVVKEVEVTAIPEGRKPQGTLRVALTGDPNSLYNLTTGVGEPTEDARVRQAMNYAVDLQAIVDVIFGGFGQPAAGFISFSELGGDAIEPFGYDPEKAKQLLLWNGRDRHRLLARG